MFGSKSQWHGVQHKDKYASYTIIKVLRLWHTTTYMQSGP